MTQDKDPEAFEQAALDHGVGWRLNGKEYIGHGREHYIASGIWQAARDHYAPKLTEKEAVEILYKGMKYAPYKAGRRNLAYGITALKAAGMRFKEEA